MDFPFLICYGLLVKDFTIAVNKDQRTTSEP